MATVTAKVKIKNKDRDENPLWVIFRHQRIEVTVSTGELLSPKCLKKGKVVGDRAIALNELVSTIGSDLQKAYDIVYQRAEGLTSLAVKKEYERIEAERLTKLKWDKFLHKDETYAKNQRIGQSTRQIYRLGKEIEEAKTAIALHQQRLAELTGTVATIADEKKDWFTTYIDKYMDEKLNNMQRNTKGTYKAVRTVINEYNPKLRIQDVTRGIMLEIENHMIQKGTKNTTIENYMGKIKAVCNYYSLEVGLSHSFKQYMFELPTQPNDVIHLSVQQLKDFWGYQKQALVHEKQPGRTTPKKSYVQVRDMFMFMCATSLRYSDLFQGDFREFIQAETLEDGTVEEHIIMYPKKTRTKRIKVTIPMTPIVKTILERNDYRFKTMKDSFFRDLLREYCSDIPSFQMPVTKHEYQGQDRSVVLSKASGEKIKFWEALGSHSGRRTWTNFAFQSGWTIPEIAGVTGHINLNTLMVYASKARVVRGNVKPLDVYQTLQP